MTTIYASPTADEAFGEMIGGGEWLERHVPLLVDFECPSCGAIGDHEPDCNDNDDSEAGA